MVKKFNCISKGALFKPVILICIILSVFIGTAIFAYADSTMWDEIEKYTADQNVQQEAAKTVSPVLRFFFFIFAVVATIGAIIVVFGILKKAINVKRGKDGFDKKWMVETAAVLIIFMIVGGGTWIQFFKTGQKLVVDPATNIVTKDYSGTGSGAAESSKSSGNSTKSNAGQSQSSNKK
jgi:uncharacterized membrane protein YgcG